MSQKPEYYPKIKELPPDLRPRERMLEAGPGSLSNAELLAILLRTGNNEESALQMAHRLLTNKGGLRFLGEAQLRELMSIKGVGLAKASQIKAAVELGRRIVALKGDSRTVVKSPGDVAALVMDEMRFLDREHFQILCLNTKNHVTARETVSIGGLDSSLVHPREVFKNPIKWSAAAIILIHNHPSGDPSPSKEDVAVTTRLVEAGRILGIGVLDHIIIGDDRYCSLKEKGLI